MTITDRRGRTVDGTDSSASPADPNPGLAIKQACLVATTANITLSGLQSIDGVTVAENDRVLVKSQTTGSENGIYTASSGNWSRSVDWDGTHEIARGTQVLVTTGTVNALKIFSIRTADPLVIGTTNLSILDLAPNPAISVHRNGIDQTGIATSTFTKIQFTTEEFDTNSNFDNATNYRFTPTVAGKYLVTLAATVKNLGSGKFMALSIEKNGSRFKDVLTAANGAISDAGTSITALIDFNGSSDYIEGFVFHNHGSSRDVYGDTNLIFMTAARVAT